MGSKRKLAYKILDAICAEKPDTEHLYDLFGGGASISLTALKYGLNAYYNELNPAIVALLKHCLKNGVTEEMYQWIPRERFLKEVTGAGWWAGFLQLTWSFGNNQQSYVYGEDREVSYGLMHSIVVDQDIDAYKKLLNILKVNEKTVPYPTQKTVNARRLFIGSCIKKAVDAEIAPHYSKISHLERIEKLRDLKDLEGQERLTMYNTSYELVPINTPIENTVLYLDPPYENTAKYAYDTPQDEIYDYFINTDYPCFLSSYDVLKLEKYKWKSFKHATSYGTNALEVEEVLYWNGK
jgi:16S rRNA G966 N2-methylase RsmD